MSDLGPSADGEVAAGAVSLGGGCGSVHPVQVDNAGHPYIDCDTCAPRLAGSHYGWAANPAGVPLTPDEQSERELAERDGVAMQRIVLKSVTDSLVGQAVAAKQTRIGLLEQLKGMSAEDRSELLGLLQGEPEHAQKPRAVKPGSKA
jgi:hypothetical protein